MYNSIKTWQTISKKQLSQTVAAFITEKKFETFIVAGLKFAFKSCSHGKCIICMVPTR